MSHYAGKDGKAVHAAKILGFDPAGRFGSKDGEALITVEDTDGSARQVEVPLKLAGDRQPEPGDFAILDKATKAHPIVIKEIVSRDEFIAVHGEQPIPAPDDGDHTPNASVSHEEAQRNDAHQGEIKGHNDPRLSERPVSPPRPFGEQPAIDHSKDAAIPTGQAHNDTPNDKGIQKPGSRPAAHSGMATSATTGKAGPLNK